MIAVRWGVGKMHNCGTWKVKCGTDRVENCYGTVCKLRNAESLQTYSVTAEGSPFASKGSHVGNPAV